MQRFLHNRALQLAFCLGLLCIGLQAVGLDQALRFDREALQTGNWWLILTGNFVHLNWGHLLLNMTGLLLIVTLVWYNYAAWEWTVIILFSSIGVGAGLFFRDLDVFWYVGFSGTLHGLIMAGAIADLKRYPWNASLLLIVVVIKLGWEQIYGAVPGSEAAAGGAVIVNSHLYGAIGGVLIAIPLLLLRKLKDGPGSRTAPPARRSDDSG